MFKVSECIFSHIYLKIFMLALKGKLNSLEAWPLIYILVFLYELKSLESADLLKYPLKSNLHQNY